MTLGGTEGIPAGGQLRVYPGCDGPAQTCDDNTSNSTSGGLTRRGGKSPFDGDQVW